MNGYYMKVIGFKQLNHAGSSRNCARWKYQVCQPTIIAVTNVNVFEANHSFHDVPPPYPQCKSLHLPKQTTPAPAIAGGISTPPGSPRATSKEESQDKWAEPESEVR